MASRWASVLNDGVHCARVRTIMGCVWLMSCSDSAQENASKNHSIGPVLSSCEQSLEHLEMWSERSKTDSKSVAGMLLACEAGTSMITPHQLDCLLLESPEKAAECTLRQERQTLIDACIEDVGESERSECETALGAFAPVVLEARTNSFRSGYWLDLWSCHSANDGTEITDRETLVTCGLETMRRLKTGECQMGQVAEQDCNARWQMQAPMVEQRLRSSL